MKILIIGGTQFSGLHLARGAAAAGHTVAVLHRGRHAEGIPAGVRTLVGDRDPTLGDGVEQIRALVAAGERWDAVIDMCGFVPRVVRASVEALRHAAGMYLFVSSVSVYPVTPDGAPHESSPVIELDDPAVETVNGETYGGLKVLCERVVHDSFGDRATVVRPGLIVGPGDPTDRFTYWVRRLAGGGRVLAPSEVDCPTRWIDGRDLAAFMLRCATDRIGGTFNALGPREPIGFGDFLEGVARGVGAPAIEWVRRDAAWRETHGVRAWLDVPVFTGPDGASIGRASAELAYGAGLSARALEATARDTLAWDRERGSPAITPGLSVGRERELLDAGAVPG